MKICKEDHNWYRINTDKACEHFEGDLTYLNTFCIMGNYKPVAVFKNANPDRSKNHKDYMLLWTDNGQNVIVSGLNAHEMENDKYQKGMYCPDCKDVIYSVNRHDYRYCSCSKCIVDGGKDYFRTNMAGKTVKIDLLTDNIEIIEEMVDVIDTMKTCPIEDIEKDLIESNDDLMAGDSNHGK